MRGIQIERSRIVAVVDRRVGAGVIEAVSAAGLQRLGIIRVGDGHVAAAVVNGRVCARVIDGLDVRVLPPLGARCGQARQQQAQTSAHLLTYLDAVCLMTGSPSIGGACLGRC